MLTLFHTSYHCPRSCLSTVYDFELVHPLRPAVYESDVAFRHGACPRDWSMGSRIDHIPVYLTHTRPSLLDASVSHRL